MKNIETEVRFLEIDEAELKKKLSELGAHDKGRNLLQEIIFYDQAGQWQKEGKKMVRLRAINDHYSLSFKQNLGDHVHGTSEIEVEVDNLDNARSLLKEIGLAEYRQQEKYRHSFVLGEVTVDIDQWPKIPAYVELEAGSEAAIRSVAEQLGFDWSTANTQNAAWVIENIYNIPVRQLKYFTFDKIG